jgi:cytochrome c551/c552
MFTRNKRQTGSGLSSIWIAFILSWLSPQPIFAQTSDSAQPHLKGLAVFREKGCVLCHPVYGRGGKGAPDLGKRQFYGTHLELAAKMWNHFPKMYAKMQKMDHKFEELAPEEMVSLLDYLSFIRYIGEPGSEYQGRKLIASKGCKKCHRFGGDGGDIGPEIGAKDEYLSPLKFVEAMWNHGPEMHELFEENDIKRPKFKRHEIIDIAYAVRAYTVTSNVPLGSYDIGNPEQGARLSREKGCMVCHSYRGEGGDLAVDFDDVDFNRSVTEIAGEMWNHAPEMWNVMKDRDIAIPRFAEGEMADILAYLYTLKVNDNPGDAGKGPKIIENKGCLKCHSLAGEGGEISADLATVSLLDSPQGMISAMWNHAPAMQDEQVQQKMKWVMFKGQELADLYAFLRSVRE